MKRETVGNLALIFNILGAFVLAISMTGDVNSGLGDTSGIVYGYAIVNEFYSKIGLYLFILGFALQFLERISATKERVARRWIIGVSVATGAIFITTIHFLLPYIIFP
jgi:hypothetical protein